MGVIKCKMCGGDMELSPDKTIGTCEYCGSTMTMPKVSDEQRTAAFDRGNHFRRLGEFDKALSVYERIIQEDENDAEAHWCCALCRFGIEYVKDPAGGEYLPTCHRASFDSFLEDVDFKAALTHADVVARAQYQKDGEQIAAVQRDILTTVQKEEPFDVFICYKESDERGQRTVDSTLAQDIYYQLTEQGRRVFFARITLEDKAGQEYEPYIFAALHSAKVMVAVGTRPEYLNAVWVKNEWSRYLSLMKSDRKRLLIPCYRDMDPYDLPEQLSVLQAYDMSKIGFIQDLIRGVNKVLDADKKAPVVQETVVMQGEGGANLSALLKRGGQALEDGEWNKASEFFDRVLDMDAECAEAFLGKALAGLRCGSTEDLVKALTDFEPVPESAVMDFPDTDAQLKTLVDRYQIPGYLSEGTIRENFESGSSCEYQTDVPFWEKKRQDAEAYFEHDKLMSRAIRYAKGDTAEALQRLRNRVGGALRDRVAAAREADRIEEEKFQSEQAEKLEEAAAKIERLYAEANEKREADYSGACREMEAAKSPKEYTALEARFKKLGNYKDSAERREQCAAAAERRRDEQRRHAEQKRRNLRKKLARAAVSVMSFALLALAATRVVIPARHYKEAEKLLSQGDRTGAAITFGKARGYKDAREQSFALWEEIAQRNVLGAGPRHTLGLKTNGTVVAAGESFKRYGENDVSDWRDIIAVSAGLTHAVGLRADGTVATAGSNYDDQIDVSSWRDIVAVSTGDFDTVGLKSDGTVVATGNKHYDSDRFKKVSGWRNIIAVSTSFSYTVGLKSDGTVVAVGDNNFGQCDVYDWNDIVAVSTGDLHTVGLKSDGTVVAVGYNGGRQCDVSDWSDIIAISAGTNHTVGLKSDGTVVAVGFNEYGQCSVSDWSDIVAISAGGVHTVGLKSDGTVVFASKDQYDQFDVSGWSDIRMP